MKLKKSTLVTVIGLIILTGAIAGVKALQIKEMISKGESFEPPPQTVTAFKASVQNWESILRAVGSLEAVQGIVVTAEMPGKVDVIKFESGGTAKAGQLLLRQDISSELSEKKAAESDFELAKKNLQRGRSLLPSNVISRSDFDDLQAHFDKAAARLDAVRSAISKKTIRAPFDARIGIRQADLGEVLEIGQPIVTLQTLDPIFVNFQLPQSDLPKVRKGLPVRISTDELNDRHISGKITAINAQVDPTTRNIRIQATLHNPNEQLTPGMFVKVAVVLPEEKPVLVIPATAVLYAPYSDSVFVVENSAENTGPGKKVLRQQFVELGKTQGDFITVISGLKQEETVVSTGVFKLRNGQAVVIDNSHAPEFHLEPQPDNA